MNGKIVDYSAVTKWIIRERTDGMAVATCPFCGHKYIFTEDSYKDGLLYFIMEYEHCPICKADMTLCDAMSKWELLKGECE